MVDIANGNVLQTELVANPGHEPRAIPKFLNRRGAKKIVCGGIGARATGLFGQYEIEIISGVEGTIDSVVEKLAHETLTGGNSICKPGAGRGYGFEKSECDHVHED